MRYQKLEREPLLEAVADQIAAGNVVGWFQGRMEWGPRALGNRSIVAHPGLPNMKDILNARIKHREWFRPFAPSIMAERQHEYFEHDHPSPFMLHVYKIRPEKRAELCAVNHVDDTGRLQTVSREENPLYYDLIQAFERKTGIPVILNTSFNENEPIVCAPEEAIDCFKRTRMDALAIGPYLRTEDRRTRRMTSEASLPRQPQTWASLRIASSPGCACWRGKGSPIRSAATSAARKNSRRRPGAMGCGRALQAGVVEAISSCSRLGVALVPRWISWAGDLAVRTH